MATYNLQKKPGEDDAYNGFTASTTSAPTVTDTAQQPAFGPLKSYLAGQQTPAPPTVDTKQSTVNAAPKPNPVINTPTQVQAPKPTLQMSSPAQPTKQQPAQPTKQQALNTIMAVGGFPVGMPTYKAQPQPAQPTKQQALNTIMAVGGFAGGMPILYKAPTPQAPTPQAPTPQAQANKASLYKANIANNPNIASLLWMFSDETLKENVNTMDGDEISRILNDLTNGAR